MEAVATVSWARLDDDGCSVNLKYVVSVELDPFVEKQLILHMVSGSKRWLKNTDVASLGLVRVAVFPDVWVNPEYVCSVDVAFNKDAALADAFKSDFSLESNEKYMQVRVETVLGEGHWLWADTYGVKDVGWLVQALKDKERV